MPNPEAKLKLSDSIYSVIYEVIDKGSGSQDDLMEARLSAEDLSMMIVDSVFSDISESLDASGAIIATLNTTGPLDEE
jgi:hypothetical protein